jgi:hypothetical protein
MNVSAVATAAASTTSAAASGNVKRKRLTT